MGEAAQPSSFGDFVREHGERAFRFAYRLCGNAEDAKDLVQEGFFRALRGWDRFDAAQGADGWLLGILRNLYLDARKRYDRRNVSSLDAAAGGEEGLADTVADSDEPLLERLEREESVAELRRVLESLSFDYRVVLTLCDMEGLSYEDIARVLDIPLGTVRSRVNRSREALRRALARREGVRP